MLLPRLAHQSNASMSKGAACGRRPSFDRFKMASVGHTTAAKPFDFVES